MKRICLTLDKEVKEQLEKEAKEKGLSLSGYIRFILTERKKWNDSSGILKRTK